MKNYVIDRLFINLVTGAVWVRGLFNFVDGGVEINCVSGVGFGEDVFLFGYARVEEAGVCHFILSQKFPNFLVSYLEL